MLHIQNSLKTTLKKKHAEIERYFADVQRNSMRRSVLDTGKRMDGRACDEIRPIWCEVNPLPMPHGSAYFQRGETLALATCTLGTKLDEKMVDNVLDKSYQRFLLHYNFPPFCTGEAKAQRGVGRREIGHGHLAWRGLKGMIPEDFPYTVRLVSQVLESNGSSSMASVCGASLALMDAGVPIKAAVAGIAMGLVKEEEKFVVLSDILGDEDHLGDMDFKVAGTREGVTALQMDIKIEGITPEIMQIALNQAKGARMHILGVMEQAIPAPRADISDYAPRIHTMKIDPKKIKDVIGKGGATIRALTEETGTSIDIDDDGTVKIAAVDSSAAKNVMVRIEEIVAEVEAGAIYKGKVTRLADFGAFVAIVGNKEGLVHISQIAEERVEKVSDYLQVGQEVTVKVVEIDRQGRIRLTNERSCTKTRN